MCISYIWYTVYEEYDVTVISNTDITCMTKPGGLMDSRNIAVIFWYVLTIYTIRRQAIIWTNAGILFNGPLGTNFNEILIAIQTFSFKKMLLKLSSAKWWPFCPGDDKLTGVHLIELTQCQALVKRIWVRWCSLITRRGFDIKVVLISLVHSELLLI